jgi:hypothetical protein
VPPAGTVVAACLSAIQQRQPARRERAQTLWQACGRATAALTEWVASASWLGAPAVKPQLRTLSALQVLRPLVGQHPGSAGTPAAATMAAAAARALLGDAAQPLHVASGGLAGSWAALLQPDGGIAAPGRGGLCLQDLTPLLQVLRSAAGSGPRAAAELAPALGLLQQQAVLAAAAAGGECGTLQRVLAEAQGLGGGEGARQARLVGSRLLLECADGSAGRAEGPLTGECGSLVANAVREHLAALAGSWPSQLAARAREGGGSGGGQGTVPTEDPSYAAGAFMSLAAVLRKSPLAAAEAAAAAGAEGVGPRDWRGAFAAAMQGLQTCGLLRSGDPGCAAGLDPAALELAGPGMPAAACYASAALIAPQQPAPWRALGDFLHDLASQQSDGGRGGGGGGGSGGVDGSSDAPGAGNRLPPAAAQAYALACEALCRDLAASAASRRLAAPRALLAPLLKLLRLALDWGPQLEPQLRASLGASPAAAWQALAPQLFAALSHRQPAVRGLAAELLCGVAAAAPCSVLFPCVVELRGAEERGEEVGGCLRPGLPVETWCVWQWRLFDPRLPSASAPALFLTRLAQEKKERQLGAPPSAAFPQPQGLPRASARAVRAAPPRRARAARHPRAAGGPGAADRDGGGAVGGATGGGRGEGFGVWGQRVESRRLGPEE